MKKLIAFVVFLSMLSFVNANSVSVCNYPNYEGVCCDGSSDYKEFPSGIGCCFGTQAYFDQEFCGLIEVELPEPGECAIFVNSLNDLGGTFTADVQVRYTPLPGEEVIGINQVQGFAECRFVTPETIDDYRDLMTPKTLNGQNYWESVELTCPGRNFGSLDPEDSASPNAYLANEVDSIDTSDNAILASRVEITLQGVALPVEKICPIVILGAPNEPMANSCEYNLDTISLIANDPGFLTLREGIHYRCFDSTSGASAVCPSDFSMMSNNPRVTVTEVTPDWVVDEVGATILISDGVLVEATGTSASGTPFNCDVPVEVIDRTGPIQLCSFNNPPYSLALGNSPFSVKPEVSCTDASGPITCPNPLGGFRCGQGIPGACVLDADIPSDAGDFIDGSFGATWDYDYSAITTDTSLFFYSPTGVTQDDELCYAPFEIIDSTGPNNQCVFNANQVGETVQFTVSEVTGLNLPVEVQCDSLSTESGVSPYSDFCDFTGSSTPKTVEAFLDSNNDGSFDALESCGTFVYTPSSGPPAISDRFIIADVNCPGTVTGDATSVSFEVIDTATGQRACPVIGYNPDLTLSFTKQAPATGPADVFKDDPDGCVAGGIITYDFNGLSDYASRDDVGEYTAKLDLRYTVGVESKQFTKSCVFRVVRQRVQTPELNPLLVILLGFGVLFVSRIRKK
ncbi:hypothetical protein HUU53_03460 [Candidatus Micrarchaeota archaeon]|nr:hypothetical protein [Candidatus Micrarchaeota archaeon]